MGWKTGVYCQKEQSHHDDTGSVAHPARDLQLQSSHIHLSSICAYSTVWNWSLFLPYLDKICSVGPGRTCFQNTFSCSEFSTELVRTAYSTPLHPVSYRTAESVGARILLLISN